MVVKAIHCSAPFAEDIDAHGPDNDKLNLKSTERKMFDEMYVDYQDQKKLYNSLPSKWW